MSHLSDLICWYHVDIMKYPNWFIVIPCTSHQKYHPCRICYLNIYIYISIILHLLMKSENSVPPPFENHSKGPSSYSLFHNDYNGCLWLIIMNMICTIIQWVLHLFCNGCLWVPQNFQTPSGGFHPVMGYPKLAGWWKKTWKNRK